MDHNLDGNIVVNNEIEISAEAIGQLLVANPVFVKSVALVVWNELIRMGRSKGNLFGKWAQRPLPSGVVNQPTGTKRLG